MKHTVELIIEDEVGTPYLRILQRCTECDMTVSTRVIDVSTIQESEAGAVGAVFGSDDGEAWVAHAQQGKK